MVACGAFFYQYAIPTGLDMLTLLSFGARCAANEHWRDKHYFVATPGVACGAFSTNMSPLRDSLIFGACCATKNHLRDKYHFVFPLAFRVVGFSTDMSPFGISIRGKNHSAYRQQVLKNLPAP